MQVSNVIARQAATKCTADLWSVILYHFMALGKAWRYDEHVTESSRL